MKIKFIFMMFIFILMGCEHKSEEYYKAHPEEARKRSLECRHNAIISLDCVNAYKVGFPRDENLTQE
ncbi:hypothetical protein DU472_03670 [Campylobacter novaezeelandiae]|uniref:EexN family lipoprotein n=1 Tax=Campylobacter novaezeelandiae TaxID=2267891 RepID=A0A4Q9JWP6_9BACT|nr:EexN family lipoprotein [Campylobacter novaezeelandiae]QWU79930.1 hypothetical protein CNZW441b_0599 [Campylobacter novaezeelandiae]TBR78026.1 hypothetical protein DU474_07660 [Campylobacter novaezeelandiae]TBR79513.1 hypothetical protein DU474_03525 [Campylobacter novaezeelandiae]TBR81166.1 hypothetical protein DU472_03670 [Campylobacter novaezeelandiae]TBR81449.1 hypothetical protein DU473_03670 [Campylobacter novaezeelandiae]